MIAKQDGTVEQTTSYYPFGGIIAEFSTNQNLQRYKYNGKELDRMHGLNWYDYGARNYDAVLGRWDRMDPLCEKYYNISPYAYCAGNPVNSIDINGDSIKIMSPELVENFKDAFGNNLTFTNGYLDPNSIRSYVGNGNEILDELYYSAINENIVEIFSDIKYDCYLNGERKTHYFDSPNDTDDNDFPLMVEYFKDTMSFGKHIDGNLGQTLFPVRSSISGKQSTNNNIQVVINSKGTFPHRSIGLIHELAHVTLFLQNKPYSHNEPGVNNFIDSRTLPLKKRYGYDY